VRILVPLDGSHFGEAILATVAKLARPLGATVELFSVGRLDQAHQTSTATGGRDTIPVAAPSGTRLNVPLLHEVLPPTVESREQALSRIEAHLRDYLQTCEHELEGIRTEITVDIADDPATVIINHARRGHVDLIAMATHGRSGLSHLLAGSVCEQVIRSGVAPVMVLRP
jgi:nucleotide-binding universal stress UspA family protein